MFSAKDFKEMAGGSEESMAKIDQQIDKNIQQREISKVRDAFYEQMKSHFQIRKSKEYITLKCGSLCFDKNGNNFFDDELARKEKTCLLNCYHKTFRYLAHANTAYTFFTSDPEMLKDLLDEEPEEVSVNATDAEGNEYLIPSRKDMENMAENKNQFEQFKQMEEEMQK